MARRTVQTAAQVESGQENQALDLTGLETAEELNPALERLYAEMGTDEFGKIKVYIYKIIAETGKEPRVWEGVPGDYDLMSVAKRFGSADYRVKVYVPHESGRIVVGANTVFPILLDPAEDAKLVAQREGTSAPQVNGQQHPFSPEMLAVAIAQGIKAAMPAPVDTLAQMDRLAGVMQKLMPQHNPAPQGQSFTETLAAAKSLLELTRGMGTPIDGEGNVDAKGLAIARGVDLVARMFEKSMEPKGANIAAGPAKPGNIALSAPDAQSPAQGEQSEEIALTTEQAEELEMLRLQIKMVNRRAANGEDPVTLIDEYYDDLPDPIFDNIVFNPQWFEVLCVNVAECAQFKDWYEKLRTALIAKGLKEGDLQSLADGSLQYVEETVISAEHGTTH